MIQKLSIVKRFLLPVCLGIYLWKFSKKNKLQVTIFEPETEKEGHK